jgi:hypothetical protein
MKGLTLSLHDPWELMVTTLTVEQSWPTPPQLQKFLAGFCMHNFGLFSLANSSNHQLYLNPLKAATGNM